MTTAFKQGFNDMLLKMAEEASQPEPTVDEIAAQPLWKSMRETEIPKWNRWVPWRTTYDDIHDREQQFNDDVRDHNRPIQDARNVVARNELNALLESGDEKAIAEKIHDIKKSGRSVYTLPWDYEHILNSNMDAGDPRFVSDVNFRPENFQGNRGTWALEALNDGIDAHPFYGVGEDPFWDRHSFVNDKTLWDRNAWAFTPAGTNLAKAFSKMNPLDERYDTNSTRRINWDLFDHQTGKNPSRFSLDRDGAGNVTVKDQSAEEY
jgi:hypothetical protein